MSIYSSNKEYGENKRGLSDVLILLNMIYVFYMQTTAVASCLPNDVSDSSEDDNGKNKPSQKQLGVSFIGNLKQTLIDFVLMTGLIWMFGGSFLM